MLETQASVDASAVTHPADRLAARIRDRGAPVCVGLDPVLGRLPAAVGAPAVAGGDDAAVDAMAAAAAIEAFSRGVIDAVAPHVPAVKPQSACFERYGSAGFAALERTIRHARDAGLVVVLDAKRGDIGISAAHYAMAAVRMGADWLTVSPYLGLDGITPVLDAGLGAFALVRTSNPDGDAIQTPELAAGGTVADLVAALVDSAGSTRVGASGLSALGAVVGATKPEDAGRLRGAMPRAPFLVPGFGAQGGGVDDVRPLFGDSGTAALITASRSVIYAADAADPKWTDAVAESAERLAEEIGAAAGLR